MCNAGSGALIMATTIADDAGKWIQLTQDCNAMDTFDKEYLMVVTHKATSGRSSEDRSDVAVFWDDYWFDQAKQDVATGDQLTEEY